MIFYIILIVIFLSFACWYDGWWISPLTEKEGKILYKALSEQRLEEQAKSSVNPDSVHAFARTDDGKEFCMVNLIKDKNKDLKNENIGTFEE